MKSRFEPCKYVENKFVWKLVHLAMKEIYLSFQVNTNVIYWYCDVRNGFYLCTSFGKKHYPKKINIKCNIFDYH